ncbi:MAG: TIGR00730 family Rossman fold protein [Nocardioides sp.]
MRIAVFLGSSSGAEAHQAAARDLGRAIGAGGHGLVYGGARVGLMGVLADATLAAGGEVVGVLPANLVEREVGHRGLTRLELVDTMHERKARMAELADAFVALPGGTGTLDELVEIMSWWQLRLHDKPIALYDVDGFWEPFVALFDHMVASGYAPAAARSHLRVVTSPAEVIALLAP